MDEMIGYRLGFVPLKIDVIVLTKNSEKMISHCLSSIYENIPVNRLIIVDGFSTDKTLKLAERFPRVEIVSTRGTRGKARQLGIEKVKTKWFLFVDSDAILCDNWFEKARKHIREDVGAIYGLSVAGNATGFRKKLLQILQRRTFKLRGCCQDLLVRYSAVDDIKIPHYLHTLEDAFIKNHILSKGFKVLALYSPYCRHHKSSQSLLSKENFISTALEFRQPLLALERIILAMVFSMVFLLGDRNT
ncbi:MAG: glycosyltransferase family A protein [Candidatus Bathyarchaeota archaeon]|jgi:glycosyltransferase involved in cell wall biosynthesis